MDKKEIYHLEKYIKKLSVPNEWHLNKLDSNELDLIKNKLIKWLKIIIFKKLI